MKKISFPKEGIEVSKYTDIVLFFILLILVTAYFFQFGTEPLNENLWTEYHTSRYTWHGISVRQNMPFLPNKLFCLLGIASSIVFLLLSKHSKTNKHGNALTRLALVAASVMCIPSYFYIFTYLCVITGAGIVVFGGLYLLYWTIKWVITGAANK